MITRRDCEELCVHDRGDVRWGGGAAQGKGQGYSLTSHRLTGRREGACVGDAGAGAEVQQLPPTKAACGVYRGRRHMAGRAGGVRQGACCKADESAAAGVFRKWKESTRN